jgi:hypothetical protein
MGSISRRVTVLLLAFALACTAAPGGERTNNGPCVGKCDSASDNLTATYRVDMNVANSTWRGETQAATAEDLMRVTVALGDQRIPADTHLFGQPVTVIPYHNADNVTDADGNAVLRGDAVIAEYFPPGEIGIAVKHHRPEHRTLLLEGGSPDAMKENFKLQDTHIEIVVGVEREGAPGAITLNNPQTYEQGRFGSASYPMIFLRLQYPEYLSPDQALAFRNNIRTMAAAFNAVSNFPGDYNGGDPLGARNPEELREHVTQMIRAIAGDESAREWFKKDENLIYCAELAFVSLSAGMHFPLNAETFVPLVGNDVWMKFVAAVEKHNAGERTAFTELNENDYAALVRLDLAPSSLAASWTYAPTAAAQSQLAFQPFTVADIVEQFLATHLPRRELGEELAPAQGAALQAMKPGLLEALSLDRVPLLTQPEIMAAPADQQPALMARYQVEGLYSNIVRIVSTRHESYQAFRSAIDPHIALARMMTGPRDASGTGLFVPPSIFHVVAQDRHPAGLLDLEYVGHGFHWSMVRRGDGPVAPDLFCPTALCGPDTTCSEAEKRCVPNEPATPGEATVTDTATLASGAMKTYTITVPAGGREVQIDLTATSGDPDLYVRRGSAPDLDNWDERPYHGAGVNEHVSITAEPGTTVHFMVNAYSDCEYSLTAKAF